MGVKKRLSDAYNKTLYRIHTYCKYTRVDLLDLIRIVCHMTRPVTRLDIPYIGIYIYITRTQYI